MEKRQVYLDHGASTPVQPAVIDAMRPFWADEYGNPSSHHAFGRRASQALEEARRTIADLLQARPDEIIFTGCGSESDNLALRGVMLAARAAGRGNHFIISAVEHSAILQTTEQLVDFMGFEATVLPVDEYGRISLTDLQAAIQPDTVLISIIAANNEVGTLQPIEAIGQLARQRDILFHTDAIQAATTSPWNMGTQPIDLMSLAPHKFYGPKGVGILYVRQGVEVMPVLTGGSHENGRRAGTANVAFAVGAAAALEFCLRDQAAHIAHYQQLRDRLIDGLLATLPHDCILTGHPTQRAPHNASFAFRDISGNDLLIHLDTAGIAASSGSACKSGNPKPSAVLQALGLDDTWTRGGLRLTVGLQNTKDEIDYVLATIPGIIEKLKKINLLFA
ncbi:MAG: cysteine desulfurase family protein [Chloroflexota bacterium]|jgi:cysteine desulfurase